MISITYPIVLVGRIENVFEIKRYSENFSVTSVLFSFIEQQGYTEKKIIFKLIKSNHKDTISEFFNVYNKYGKDEIYKVSLEIEMFYMEDKQDEKKYYNYFVLDTIQPYLKNKEKSNEHTTNNTNSNDIKPIIDNLNKEEKELIKLKEKKYRKDNYVKMQENQIINILETAKTSVFFRGNKFNHSSSPSLDFEA